ncbi:M55 family metallopeptidase [Streptomyces sp. NPDC056178]|uniref:M55 family metallopeptidase n=1 Tax=unclassified Streptomyces TaxID=2593676 RepID=UPI0035DB363F
MNLSGRSTSRIAGRSTGGIGLDATMAGHMGMPGVLFSGDDTACAELSEEGRPHAGCVRVFRQRGQVP